MTKTEIFRVLRGNGWTLRQIAGALGMPYDTVQKWSTGNRPAPRWQIARLVALPEKPPLDCPLAPMRPQKKQNKTTG